MTLEIAIAYTTPSRIDIECAGKKASLQGESFARGHGSPDFVVFANQPACWDTPFGKERIEEAERQAIQAQVLGLLRARGWSIELEQ